MFISIRIKISGMKTAICAAETEALLTRTEGVTECAVDFYRESAEIVYDSLKIAPAQLLAVIRNSGLEAKESLAAAPRPQSKPTRKRKSRYHGL
ncbi:MAG: heavy metal-associated domain-containing protein [Oscillospiraceae bacterium]